MPRVSTLNPELRVSTSAPVDDTRSLGELPTALGIEFKKSQRAFVPMDPPIERRTTPIGTTEETRELITRSYRAEAPNIKDQLITGFEYKPQVMSVGRPTKYHASFPSIAFRFALLGLSDERIAETLQIDVTTFYVWQKEKPEFSQAIYDGRENADGIVINAMFKRATGFKYDAVKIFHNKDDGTVCVPYEEYVPPDTNAGKYWLSVRRGKLRKDGWDDTNDSGSGAPSVQVNINVTDPQEAARQYREIMQIEGVVE